MHPNPRTMTDQIENISLAFAASKALGVCFADVQPESIIAGDRNVTLAVVKKFV
jgi:hypothetical protein